MVFKFAAYHRYLPLKTSDVEANDSGHHKSGAASHRLITVLLVLCAAAAGFLAGRVSTSSSPDSTGLLPSLGNEAQVWRQNISFSGPPTEETERAWESIYPVGRGFVRHDAITHDRVGSIAVFHQIHCVHGIRVAYYAVLQRSQSDNGSANPFVEKLAAMDDLHHVAHCFDYLRRSLMCASDTNVEYPDENHVTSGWNNAKTCRDYESVKQWVEQWRVGDRGDIQ
ncbi:Uu.00g020400.m01.CDS01 [Anthostomella pinea]|uniref:Uu.00g020400.m01.CDS01 n=1 Tax=Anthostomella pinea TaxID=933095 RepID=A0AAI8VZH4_9PEZI|nr:Uu.00g020400.m01.CDS01 [Anthostomella pinea]